MTATFVHLHVHSEYSLVDGIVRIKPLIEQLVDDGMPAVAITDQANLFATVKFYRAAVSAGIKPIIGTDIWLENEQDAATPYRLVLLCQNQSGYHNLIKLVSQAYTQGQANGRPTVARQWLQAPTITDGLIALSGALAGDIGQALLRGDQARAEQFIQTWQHLFPQRFYLELQRTGRPSEDDYIQAAVALARTHHVPVVATNDVRFLQADDFDAHEARVCINQGRVLDDADRPQPYSAQQYLRSSAEMCKLFADIPAALANTVEIAKRCNLELTLNEVFLPNFPIPSDMTIETYLAQQADKGLQERLDVIFADRKAELAQLRQPYDERLQLELDVINRMGYPGYFLIVADFIQWAKENGIPVGPGRGSGAGSLVAYALKITNLDPLQYDLLFERFLNPERVSMPDFDIDFCMDGRDRVIEYVAQRYGRESVSQIITYGTMAAKAVVRDVGRVLGMPYGFVDKIAKLIPFELGITLSKALAEEEALRERYSDEEEVRGLIDLAMKLEGITRNAGKHAGGVVIAPSNLTDFAPLYCEPSGESLVTQYDKDDVESVGLVKFDFLGLRTLTIIDWACQTVNHSLAQQQLPLLDVDRIPLDDEASFKLLKACMTTAVFQLESRGMKDLIRRLQPDCFEDIIALVALFRPGPLQSGMVDDFIDRKHGRAKVEYPHADIEWILRPTYGVILYQEQVMQIAQVLAGYTLGGADLLRRAMGKKKPEEMAKQRAIFVEGATNRGVDGKVATSIFDLMEKFAGYGFNKSHSAAYALVSYQTAWLKAHYPSAFMAAVLSSDMDNTDKVVTLIEECRHMDLQVLSPDVNQGFYKFTVLYEDITDVKSPLSYGLGAVKGVGEGAIEAIITAREQGGKFADLFDFCERVGAGKVNRRVLEALIKAGAFDSMEIAHRACLLFNVDNALQAAEQSARNQASGQDDLFAEPSQETASTNHLLQTDIAEWRDEQRLAGEKETLGLYLTGHPMQRYRQELNHFITATIAQLRPNREQSVVVAGLVIALRTMNTRRGDRMAFVTLDDQSGRLEIAVFADVYQEYRDLLVKDQLLIIEGEVNVDDYSGGYKMSAKRLLSLSQARQNYAKYLLVKLRGTTDYQRILPRLQQCLQPFSGGQCPVVIQYQRHDAKAKIVLGPEWRIVPSDELLVNLGDLLGEEDVEMSY